jgi:hypothetical protein
LEYTHTLKDTLDTVDTDMVKHTAEYLSDAILGTGAGIDL